MKVIRIEPGHEPRVVDIPARKIEKALDDLVHEEVLPVAGTMSLSALRDDKVGITLCRLNELFVHRLEHVEIALNDH